MLNFDFSAIIPSLPFLLKGLWISAQITLCAIVVGILWGTVLAVMRLYLPKPIAWIAAFYVNTFRSVPLIMVLLWFYLVIGPGLQTFLGLGSSAGFRLTLAMVAFSLFEAAYYSEIIRAGIISVRQGQNNAALALGMTRMQSLYYVILPQAFRNMVPLLLTQAIILFQDTSLVYVISLTDFFRATDISGYNNNAKAEFILFAGLVYFVICFSVSTAVRYVQSRNKI